MLSLRRARSRHNRVELIAALVARTPGPLLWDERAAEVLVARRAAMRGAAERFREHVDGLPGHVRVRVAMLDGTNALAHLVSASGLRVETSPVNQSSGPFAVSMLLRVTFI
jgi:hypothetical protein